MKIIDHYINNTLYLKNLDDIEFWRTESNKDYGNLIVNGLIDYCPTTTLAKLVKFIYEDYLSDLMSYQDITRIEYWVNVLDEFSELDWHQDKDEAAAQKGELKHPIVSVVYYPYKHKVWGGYLEIEHTDEMSPDYERIKPVYDRLVIFDPTLKHRVSKVLAGTRVGLQLNLWKD